MKQAKTPEHVRDMAARLLEISASTRGELLQVVADDLGLTWKECVQLARKAFGASLGAGNFREVRAEAACKLREGWNP